MYRGMEDNRFPKRVMYMNLESTRPRGKLRKQRQDEMREDRRIVGGEKWQEKVYKRGMEEARQNGEELSHSAHANGTNE
jgi:5'-3' exonuclease